MTLTNLFHFVYTDDTYDLNIFQRVLQLPKPWSLGSRPKGITRVRASERRESEGE